MDKGRSEWPERDAFLALIGSGLRRERHRLDWSQRKLAEVAGVDQSLISRLENGLAPGIRYERFIRILWALGWPVTRRESERAGWWEPPPLRPPWHGT
jgi:hypothetical protein